MKRTIYNMNIPVSQQRRYSNADVTGGSAATVVVKAIASPMEYGAVKYEVNGGIGTVKEDAKKQVKSEAQYSRFSNLSASGGGDESLHNHIVSIEVPLGGHVWLTATPKEGCYFDGWSNGSTAASIKLTPTADVTVTARFKRKAETPTDVYHTVAVQVEPANGGSVTANGMVNGSVSVKEGNTVVLTATPKSGYVFRAWKCTTLTPGAYNIDFENPVMSLPVSRNHNIKAVFEPVNKPNPNTGGGGGLNDVTGGEEPVNTTADEPPINTGGGGGGGGSQQKIKVTGIRPETEEPETDTDATPTGKAKAFVKKWWWAILIVAYLVYDNWKGGKQ